MYWVLKCIARPINHILNSFTCLIFLFKNVYISQLREEEEIMILVGDPTRDRYGGGVSET